MKMYTNESQTAKLVELGFEKPESLKIYRGDTVFLTLELHYSIGELIEILPQVIGFEEKGVFYPLRVMPTVGGGWAISYCKEYDERDNELIDALYDMIVKLKEERVI